MSKKLSRTEAKDAVLRRIADGVAEALPVESLCEILAIFESQPKPEVVVRTRVRRPTATTDPTPLPVRRR